MKKSVLLVLFASLIITSCDKAKVDVDFNLDVADVYFVVDTTSTTGNVELGAASFTSTLQQELDNHDASLDDVESIEVQDVEITNLSSQTFHELASVYSYLTAPGLADQRIAFKDPVPSAASFIAMDVENVNLKDYLSQPAVGFKLTGNLTTANTQADSLKVRMSFKIHASVQP